MTDDDIANWPNLGPTSIAWLRAAGLDRGSQVRRLGPVAAYLLVKTRQSRASLNLLWALVAGETGRDWRSLGVEEKARLREELRRLESESPRGTSPGYV